MASPANAPHIVQPVDDWEEPPVDADNAMEEEVADVSPCSATDGEQQDNAESQEEVESERFVNTDEEFHFPSYRPQRPDAWSQGAQLPPDTAPPTAQPPPVIDHLVPAQKARMMIAFTGQVSKEAMALATACMALRQHPSEVRGLGPGHVLCV